MDFFLPLVYTLVAWTLGPFERVEEANPLINPTEETFFFCPLQGKYISWESDHTFNPAAVVKDNKVYLFYRAEDNSGEGIGFHTSRLGLAISSDGIHFVRQPQPIFFPTLDKQTLSEWPGGCEDPRIVEREDGLYVMTYTQWNRKIATLGIATSRDLISWKKEGYAFEGHLNQVWSKSGSIVCRLCDDRLIAAKINGRYWMYWGEGKMALATSSDLISWQPYSEEVLTTRPDHFDSGLVEPGPPALLTEKGIVLLYNGKNGAEHNDPSLTPGAYAAGQVLFNAQNPAQVLNRLDEPFFRPERPFETCGQYVGGTVFIEGLVYFKGRWLLYYGGADSVVGVASTK